MRNTTKMTISVLLSVSLLSTLMVRAQVEAVQQPLFVSSARVWSNIAIAVCFEENGFADERQWVRSAIAGSWEAASNVHFSGWDRCDGKTSSGLRIHFQDARGFTSGLGTQLDNKHNGVNLNTWVSNLCVADWSRQRCVGSTAVHEFGHALGFAHEQNRDDSEMKCPADDKPVYGDTKVGGFDMMSVLNYCNPVRNGDGKLSRNDIAGVRQFYGWSDTNAYPLQSSSDDTKTTLTVWRPSDGTWYPKDGKSEKFGERTDIPVRMDLDGDGVKDMVVWRAIDGNWYKDNFQVHCSFSGFIIQTKTCYRASPTIKQLGGSGDIPVPADYDGDGFDDYAVYRPSTGGWFFINSSIGKMTTKQGWAVRGDVPVPADYDGDGIADLSVFRPSNGYWYVINSSTGAMTARPGGFKGDIPVPADYDGDGRSDFASFRPSDGTWSISNSATGFVRLQFGLIGDIPVPADYDNDGRADITIFRPSDGTWQGIQSSNGGRWSMKWGTKGDVPLGYRVFPTL